MYRDERCQYCGTPGHIAKICWYIPKHPTKQYEIPHALATLTLDNSIVDTEWITDTGASNHMTGMVECRHRIIRELGSFSSEIPHILLQTLPLQSLPTTRAALIPMTTSSHGIQTSNVLSNRSDSTTTSSNGGCAQSTLGTTHHDNTQPYNSLSQSHSPDDVISNPDFITNDFGQVNSPISNSAASMETIQVPNYASSILPVASLNANHPSYSTQPSHSAHGMVTRSQIGITKPHPKYAMTANVHNIPREPHNVRSALKHDGWRAAMEEELVALDQNKTWILVHRDPSMNVIGSKCVFKAKLKSVHLTSLKLVWLPKGIIK